MSSAALGVGVVVGLTGMGGGALMTPVLVLGFGVNPFTAVSSDLITSAVMKPAGSIVHARRGTVNWGLVLWLMIGSVPAAFCGALIISVYGEAADAIGIRQDFARRGSGPGCRPDRSARLRRNAQLVPRERRDGTHTRRDDGEPVRVRRIPTLLVGIVGGLMVGLTSVGSGSLIIIALMLLYPLLPMGRLVGTDLVQAVPLVIAAAIGHLLFGEVDWSIVLPLIIGSVPGTIIGARLSSTLPSGIVRRALALVLLASGLRMLDVDIPWTIAAVSLAFVAATLGWIGLRSAYGILPAARRERKVPE